MKLIIRQIDVRISEIECNAQEELDLEQNRMSKLLFAFIDAHMARILFVVGFLKSKYAYIVGRRMQGLY